MKRTEQNTPIPIDLTGRQVARNTSLNIGGRVAPLLVLLVAFVRCKELILMARSVSEEAAPE